jgi:hypothetical protein
VRDAIDGARALLEILGRRIPEDLAPLRDALSRLQMAYAREVQPGAAQPAAQPSPASQPPTPGREAGERPGGGEQQGGEPGPGPAESSGRLWVPGR